MRIIRDYKIEVIRFISCVLIILTHILQYHNNIFAFWLNSTVCTFFIMSGYLISKSKIENPLEWLLNKVLRIYIPYFFVMLFFVIVFFVTGNSISLINLLVIFSGSIGFFGAISGFGHLWFVTAILVSYLIISISKVKGKKTLVISLATLLLMFIFDLIDYNFFIGIFCFVGAFVFSDIIVEKKQWVYRIVNVLFILFLCLNLLKIDSSILSLARYPFFGFSLFYLIYHTEWFTKLCYSHGDKLISFVSKYSYEIYLTHAFFILGPLSFYSRIPNIFIATLVMLTSVICLSVLINKLSFFIQKK